MRSTCFDGLQTKSEMNSLVIGEIESIMGDLSINADAKVLEIARALDCLSKAWNVKKALLQAEPEEEICHPDCMINVTKVQSLLDPWYVEQILEERRVRK